MMHGLDGWAVFVPGCYQGSVEARQACGRAAAQGPSVCGWAASSGRGRGRGAAGRAVQSFEASPYLRRAPAVATLDAHRLDAAMLGGIRSSEAPISSLCL